MASSKPTRFASHSDVEILEKRSNAVPNNTKRGNVSAANLLRQYLTEKKKDVDFEQFDAPRLAEVLSRFYMDLRTKSGELYKVTTLESLRHGLNRYLKAPPHQKRYDIIKDSEFHDANECFKTMGLEAKAASKGEIEHKDEIVERDLQKLYSRIYMDRNTPTGLANKVQFDVRFYFIRHGSENMHTMTKDTFEVAVDPSTDKRYVRRRIGELTKNHRDDKESYGAFMPEMPGNELCPVYSFQKYIEKLNPDCDRLWQYPRDTFHPEDAVWYTRKPIGKNTLAKFMSSLSVESRLSTVHTNHCIRLTGATILTRSNYSASQIMSLTGHKNVQSLSVYQRTSSEEKFSMGQTLASSLTKKCTPALPSTSVTAALPRASLSGGRSTLSVANDADLEESEINNTLLHELFTDFDSATVQTSVNQPSSLFSNCSIGNINAIIKK